MSRKIVITGAAGLVGSECSRLFSKLGYDVVGIDNYLRETIFGREASTRATMKELVSNFHVEPHEIDIRDEKIIPLIEEATAVIHTAAQPSHPKSIEIPYEDFQINTEGTLMLLEAMRRRNNAAPFLYCSTNKVYGDVPNFFSYLKKDKRFEPVDPSLFEGFDEQMRTDRCMHTPFGVSKLAADSYVQEYGKLYGLKTGVFRMGCITGGAAKAVEAHNWEPYFVKKAMTGEKLTVYGYAGYQVRDVIHARDLAELFHHFVENPRSGEVYNVGGGRENSISLLESFDLIEDITGNKTNYELGATREADHIWWISNCAKVKSHFPGWKIRTDLRKIFSEIHDVLRSTVTTISSS
jgi:CDP-paratose 2-epimerase